MANSLLCTNQVRSHGIIVDDVPKAIDLQKTSLQAIIIPQEADDNIELPL